MLARFTRKEPGRLLKTSSCRISIAPLQFAGRPLRATSESQLPSLHTLFAPVAISKLRRGFLLRQAPAAVIRISRIKAASWRRAPIDRAYRAVDLMC